MKNIQIIDRAASATLSVVQTTEEQFATTLPDGRYIEFIEDLVKRVGQEATGLVLTPLWRRPISEARGDRDPWNPVPRQ